MAILNIVKEGDPVLRKECRPVGEITPRIIRLLDDMKETLIDAEGAGLAAPQVGVMRRIAIVEKDGEYLELINPEIVSREGEQEEVEGCLSVPGIWGITHRPAKVTVKAIGRDGKEFTVSGEGIHARAFCHEIDHLSGKLFTDEAVRILSDEEVKELVG
ncbi:MAG: peptide deformylase [Clostridia bacterium]|nr:peptide deformylase [Clostridia bacterium]MBR3639717.1 peptide deformylase [Clostridia bacterium]MBR6915643.1 peptide deformylase [Clostridia bacterium]